MIGGFFNKPVGRQYVAAFVGKYIAGVINLQVKNHKVQFYNRVLEPFSYIIISSSSGGHDVGLLES